MNHECIWKEGEREGELTSARLESEGADERNLIMREYSKKRRKRKKYRISHFDACIRLECEKTRVSIESRSVFVSALEKITEKVSKYARRFLSPRALAFLYEIAKLLRKICIRMLIRRAFYN